MSFRMLNGGNTPIPTSSRYAFSNGLPEIRLAEKRASHPHPVSQAQSVERRQPVNADCFRMGPEARRLAA
jgi:hypothetical protein